MHVRVIIHPGGTDLWTAACLALCLQPKMLRFDFLCNSMLLLDFPHICKGGQRVDQTLFGQLVVRCDITRS